MSPVRSICLIVTFCICSYCTLAAQEYPDSCDKWHPQALRTEQDKFKITPTYGVFYTQELGLMGMGGFTGTYRGTNDQDVPFSTMSVSASVSTKLFLMTSIQGVWNSPYTHTWLRGLRIRYDAYAKYMPERFYGIGYLCGQAGQYGEFRDVAFRLKSDFMFKFGHFRAGPVLGFDIMKLSDFKDTVFDEEYVERYASFMAGAALEMDTRDDAKSPTKGIFLNLLSTVSPSFDSGTGWHNTLTADFYIPLWRGGCLAADIYGDLSSADAYWMQWGSFGGDSRMRGYYTGRYRDRNSISAQLELRHWFTYMHGAVLWGGAGTIFHDFASLDISHLLPTFGAGYRLNLFGLIIRLDAGFGSSGQWAISMGLGQAF